MTRKSKTSRSFSRRIFRHLLSEYLVLLFCCLAGFIVLFLVTDIFDDLQDFLKAGAPLRQTLAYFVMRQPANLVHVLPMSILLSLSFVVNNMIRHQELTAIRAAGLSVPAATLPVWILAVVLAVCVFCLNEFVGPYYLRQAAVLHERLTTDELDIKYGKSACLAYHNRAERRDWFFEVFTHEGRQKGVSVKQHNPVKRGVLWEIRAREAEFVDGRWVFHHGTRWLYSLEDMLPQREETFERLEVASLTEPPAEIYNDLRPLQELSAVDIRRFLNKNPDLPAATHLPLLATFWSRVMLPFSCIIASLYGVGMTMRAQRAGAFRGFALAIAMMVCYYIATQFFVLLGRHGIVPPVLAAVLPPLAFMAHGISVVHARR